ncbi:MAG TPA: hypothetical protein PLP27_02825 [Crocinitomicaceae bacterium]|nr:hypothetical protein [Crocinitomicaceae bacterium]
MNFKKIVLFTLIGVALFWITVIISGYHFFSANIPTTIPCILILLFGIYLFLSIRKKAGKIAISIITPIILLLYIPIMWLFMFIRIEGDLKIIKCEWCNKKVISYFHQEYWGGTPLETTGIGETYLGGLIYKTTIDTTYFAELEYAKEVDSTIIIPKSVNPTDLVFVWKGQNLLLIFKGEKMKCLPLQYRKE